MSIPVSTIVNVNVTARSSKTVLTKRKRFEDVPPHYKCCPQRIERLKHFAATEGPRWAYARTELRIACCMFCRTIYPSVQCFWYADNDASSKMIAADLIDIDEGAVQ